MWCNTDRRLFGGWNGRELSDEEHRVVVVRRLLGEEETRFLYGTFLLEPTGFLWWHETDGAAPGGAERFAYVDLAAVRAMIARPEPRSPYRRVPCGRCGCAHMWVREYGRDVCAGCQAYPDLAEVLTRLVGLARWSSHTGDRTPGVAVEREAHGGVKTVEFYHPDDPVYTLGITWYVHRDTSVDERRDPTLAPFAYLDVDDLRRRAYELYPHRQRWRSHAIWQQLRDARRTR